MIAAWNRNENCPLPTAMKSSIMIWGSVGKGVTALLLQLPYAQTFLEPRLMGSQGSSSIMCTTQSANCWWRLIPSVTLCCTTLMGQWGDSSVPVISRWGHFHWQSDGQPFVWFDFVVLEALVLVLVVLKRETYSERISRKRTFASSTNFCEIEPCCHYFHGSTFSRSKADKFFSGKSSRSTFDWLIVTYYL